LNAAGEKTDDDESAGRDAATDGSVSETAGEHEMTDNTVGDGLEPSLDDADDGIPSKQLHEQESSDSETPQLSNEVAGKGDDNADDSDKVANNDYDIIVEKEVPPEKETIRDQLEKAGIRTNGNKPYLNSCSMVKLGQLSLASLRD